MGRRDPYGDWVLFGGEHGEGARTVGIDEELLAAAREAWPHILAHARSELAGKEFGRERTAIAAEVWDGVLRSVAKTPPAEQQSPSPHFGPPVLANWGFPPPLQQVVEKRAEKARNNRAAFQRR